MKVSEAKIRQLGSDLYDEITRVTNEDAVGEEQAEAKRRRLEELDIAMQFNSLALSMGFA